MLSAHALATHTLLPRQYKICETICELEEKIHRMRTIVRRRLNDSISQFSFFKHIQAVWTPIDFFKHTSVVRNTSRPFQYDPILWASLKMECRSSHSYSSWMSAPAGAVYIPRPTAKRPAWEEGSLQILLTSDHDPRRPPQVHPGNQDFVLLGISLPDPGLSLIEPDIIKKGRGHQRSKNLIQCQIEEID